MRTKFIALAALLMVSATSFAQAGKEVTTESRAYVGVDLSHGVLLRKEPSVPDYEIRMFAGYKILPQLYAAVGFGGSNSYRTGVTAVPVFIQLRSNLLHARKVCPFLSLDAGYNFQFLPEKPSGKVRTNREVFTERLDGLTLEEFIGQFPGSEAQAMDHLTAFRNGSHRFIVLDNPYGSRRGAFVSLSLGTQVRIHEHCLDIALVAGACQYREGASIRTADNRFHDYTSPDRLPDGSPVYTEQHGSGDPVHPDLRLRIGFQF